MKLILEVCRKVRRGIFPFVKTLIGLGEPDRAKRAKRAMWPNLPVYQQPIINRKLTV